MTIKKFKSSEISKDYLYWKKLFDNEKTKILSEQSQENHVIDLIKNTKLSYMSLYNLFQKKLAKLRRYLNNVLNKKWIRFFVSFANVLIFFIFKKDEKLRLYVNYKNLNTIIIKNCHFLLFITKTLNRLYKIKRFINLNLKNVYYRIRIKKMMNEKRYSARIINILNIRLCHLNWSMHRLLFKFILIKRWKNSLMLFV